MPFSAECAFCHLSLQSIPDHRLGHSVECPRCHKCFTLAPKSQPEAAATQGPRFGRVRIASASPPPAPGPSKVALSPTGHHSSKSDSITAEKPLAGPSTQPRLPPIEAQSVRDYFGVGSFTLGSYAFLTAVLTHERFLTLGLGLAGLLCGVVGLFLSLSKQQVSLLSSAGLIVSLPTVLVALLAPDWLGIHLVGGPAKSVTPSGVAALALKGRSDFRRAPEGEKLWVSAVGPGHQSQHGLQARALPAAPAPKYRCVGPRRVLPSCAGRGRPAPRPPARSHTEGRPPCDDRPWPPWRWRPWRC